jgi:hypothetical protein
MKKLTFIAPHNNFYNTGWAEMDEKQERLDQYGCFTPGGTEKLDGQCTAIDFQSGTKHSHPMKGMDICSDLDKVDDCLMNDMLALAKKASEAIGVYIRVDMFLGRDGKIYVQEYSTNHMNGLRHCAAVKDANGCVDPCFQGAMWKNIGTGGNPIFGGPKTPIPSALEQWMLLEDESAKCGDIVKDTPITPASPSTCNDTSAPVASTKTEAPIVISAPIGQAPPPPPPAPISAPVSAPTDGGICDTNVDMIISGNGLKFTIGPTCKGERQLTNA